MTEPTERDREERIRWLIEQSQDLPMHVLAALKYEPWLRIEEAAEHFSISTRTIYRWVTAGAPFKLLPGGTMRFQITPLEYWLETQAAQAAENM